MGKGVQQHEVAGIVLAFGLDWEPVIGGNARAQALRVSRKAGSTHMVLAGSVMSVAGHGSPKQASRGGKPLHAAAQCAACLQPVGTVLLLTHIKGSGIWVLASHEGTVISRTDCFCDNAAEAHRIAGDLQEVYPQLQVIDALIDPDCFSLEMLAAQADRHTRLEQIASLRNLLTGRWRRLGLVGPAALLLIAMWHVSKDSDPSPSAPEPDAKTAWLTATEHFLARRQSGLASAESLLKTLYAVPAHVQGWTLLHIVCQAETVRWACQAVYVRGQGGANNKVFFRSLPSDWRLHVVALDQVRARWYAAGSDVPLRLADLHDADTTDRQLLSALQGVEPAFERITLGQAEALTLAPPALEGASASVRPPSIPGLSRRSLQLSGPLRSVALVLSHAQAIVWHRLELAYHAESNVSLRESRIRITLTGDIHETS